MKLLINVIVGFSDESSKKELGNKGKKNIDVRKIVDDRINKNIQLYEKEKKKMENKVQYFLSLEETTKIPFKDSDETLCQKFPEKLKRDLKKLRGFILLYLFNVILLYIFNFFYLIKI